MTRNFLKRCYLYCLQLDIYKKSYDNGPSTLKNLIATRIYICKLALFFLIIVLFTAFYPRTTTSVEYSPSSIRFSQLLHHYPNTLHCPCSKLSINYGTFASIQIKFHQVCSSEFIQQTWIDNVFAQHNQLTSSLNDYRITLTFFWQIIRDFCAISNTTWSSIITDFHGSYILSPTVLTEQSVRNQMRDVINTEKVISQSTLTRNLRLLQRMTSANQFVSGTLMNFELRHSNDATSPKMFAKKYNNCSCLNIDVLGSLLSILLFTFIYMLFFLSLYLSLSLSLLTRLYIVCVFFLFSDLEKNKRQNEPSDSKLVI